jgi:hypothetical protein
VHLPAGVAGPAPVDLDVRCFLVTHASGAVRGLAVGLPQPASPPRTSTAPHERLGSQSSDCRDTALRYGRRR